MASYKNIRIKKKGGGSRLQRVQVLASGKYKFVKNLGSKSKKKSKSTKATRRTVRKTAKKKTRRKRSKRIPLSVITGTSVSIMASPQPGWASVLENIQGGNPLGAVQSFLAAWTGILLPIGGQQTFQFNPFEALNPMDLRFAPAWKSMFWTKIGTKIIRKIAGNPFTKIPFVKDYISFS